MKSSMVPNEGDLDDTQNNKFKITTINMFKGPE